MKSEIVQPEWSALLALQRAAHATVHMLAAELAGLDLTASEINALANLADGRSRTVSELAAATGTRPTTLTSVLDRLERRGHITRGGRPGDRRAVLVQLTPSGRQAAANSKVKSTARKPVSHQSNRRETRSRADHQRLRIVASQIRRQLSAVPGPSAWALANGALLKVVAGKPEQAEQLFLRAAEIGGARDPRLRSDLCAFYLIRASRPEGGSPIDPLRRVVCVRCSRKASSMSSPNSQRKSNGSTSALANVVAASR